MKQYSQYSVNEDKVIIECVSKHIDNLTKAFTEAKSLLPNRSYGSISMRWYGYLKSNVKIFELKNSSESLVNVKIKRNTNQDITPEESAFLKFARINKINLLELKEEIIDKKVKEYRKHLEA